MLVDSITSNSEYPGKCVFCLNASSNQIHSTEYFVRWFFSRHLARYLCVAVRTLAEKCLKAGSVIWVRSDPLQKALGVKEASTFGVLVTRLVGNGGAKFKTAAQVTKTHLYLQFFSQRRVYVRCAYVYIYTAPEKLIHIPCMLFLGRLKKSGTSLGCEYAWC